MRTIRASLITLIFLSGITTIILGFFYLRYNAEHKNLTADDRKTAGGQFIKLSAGYTHYQLGGPDSGKVIILIHGFSVPYFIWDGNYEYLTSHGFRVLRYDAYGRGFSDRPDIDYTKAIYMQQLYELVTALHLKTPANLIGVSFGGKVARDFAVSYPKLVNKLILIDPAYPSITPEAPEVMAYYHELINPGKRASGQLEDFKYPQRHAGWVEKYKVQQQYHGFVNAVVSTMYHYPVNGREETIALNHTHKPVMLIWGKEDHTVDYHYSDSVRNLLKTEFLPVADAAHLPYLEHPELVNSKMLEFLRK